MRHRRMFALTTSAEREEEEKTLSKITNFLLQAWQNPINSTHSTSDRSSRLIVNHVKRSFHCWDRHHTCADWDKLWTRPSVHTRAVSLHVCSNETRDYPRRLTRLSESFVRRAVRFIGRGQQGRVGMYANFSSRLHTKNENIFRAVQNTKHKFALHIWHILLGKISFSASEVIYSEFGRNTMRI